MSSRFRPVRAERTAHVPTSGAARRGAVAAGALLTVGAFASLLSGGASAATAGSATARTADVHIAAGVGAPPVLSTLLASLGLTAATQLETAPTSAGSNTSRIALAANAVAATATTGDVVATATRAAHSTTGDSTVASAEVGLLGTNVLTTGVISSTSTCPATGAPTARTSVADVTVGGEHLDAAAGASANVAVTVVGLTHAGVTVAVSSPHSTTAHSATATGLLVTLTLHGTLVGATVSIPLGTVTLAASSCEAPRVVPPTSPTPTVTRTTAVAPTSAAIGPVSHLPATGRSAVDASEGSLPFTGTNALETVGVGGWFIAAGAWSYLFGRRTRRRH